MKSPFSLPLVAFITTYLMLLHMVSSKDVTKFHFKKFDAKSGKHLILQGDASFTCSDTLLLNKVDSNGIPQLDSVGRALYSKSVHLYDGSTRRAANIFTSFVFNISSPSTFDPPADGLTFFIAPPDSTIPPVSRGGRLGLFDANAPSNGVVAVEFDTFINDDPNNPGNLDPNYKHVGIDVNSIMSVATAEWNWVNGDLVTVTINYDPLKKDLSVYVSNKSGGSVNLTHNVDLATVLPEWVRVGFSGSTGGLTQVNNVISWSFRSIL